MIATCGRFTPGLSALMFGSSQNGTAPVKMPQTVRGERLIAFDDAVKPCAFRLYMNEMPPAVTGT